MERAYANQNAPDEQIRDPEPSEGCPECSAEPGSDIDCPACRRHIATDSFLSR